MDALHHDSWSQAGHFLSWELCTGIAGHGTAACSSDAACWLGALLREMFCQRYLQRL